MTVPRNRARKPLTRRPRSRQLAKRRQDVAAFEAWQRHGRLPAPVTDLRRHG